MIFWIVAVMCYVIAFWLGRRILPDAFRMRFRKTTLCMELALGALFVLLIAGWGEWNIANWTSGWITYGVSVVRPAIELFAFWTLLSCVFYFTERRDRS